MLIMLSDTLTGSANQQSSNSNIVVQIGRQRFKATLNDSVAARNLQRKLPMSVKFCNSPGFEEKIADLKQPLRISGMTAGGNPDVGSIAYWSPDQRLVFYWGNVGYYQGIHIIGHFDGNKFRKTVQHLGPKQTVTIRATK
ncbi:cyclophilin-like fold protein [Furfurilactobacillus milii]|nr:cyclophilin-like fold protein [Furfurilactobacillus milii]